MKNKYKTFVITEQQENILKEYLDKDVAMPMYDYLKDGEKYSSYGNFNKSKELVLPFIKYVMQKMPQEDFVQFVTAVRKHPKLKDRIKIDNNRKYIECYSKFHDGFQRVPTNQFIETNKAALYHIFEYEYPFIDFFDKFYFYINGSESLNFLRNNGQHFKSNMMLQNPEVFKTDWLIHFCKDEDDAIDIWQNGFKYGTKDLKNLAYTNGENSKKENKIGGKLSYAYNVDEILNGSFKSQSFEKENAFDNMFDQKAWERALHDCVMFKNSGVETFHSTDRENQVIFNNDNIKDAVLLKFHWDSRKQPNEKDNRTRHKTLKGEMYWYVSSKTGKPLYKSNSLTEVIRWVKDNFDQYRKQMCWK